jgi:nicotinamide mononucleotide adenylyltransferase
MDKMKRYRQLVKELPSKKIVFAFGRFQPPTTGHELLVNAVKRIAAAQKADHVIYASRTHDKKSNPLPVDRKVYYLKRMFPNTNFAAASDEIRTFLEAATALSNTYKNIVMIAGSDRVPEYKRLLDRYNGDLFKFDTIEVVSAGERDPDSDSATGMSGTKMREAAKKGDFQSFKKGLPHTLTELDGKRLMNEVRVGMGMAAIKEEIKFAVNTIREQYHAGKIFNVGDRVTDGEIVYEILDRGANYVTVVNESGDTSKKWLDSVQPINVHLDEDIPAGPTPSEITYKGYTTKNLHHSEDARKAFEMTIQRASEGKVTDPMGVLNALKATDTYMGLNDRHLTGEEVTEEEKKAWIEAHHKARESLNRIGEFMHHMDYWHMHEHELQDVMSTYGQEGPEEDTFGEAVEQLKEMKFSPADKIKVARIIASTLGDDKADEKSGPENMVNMALRKVKNKPMTKDAWKILGNMLDIAREAGIKYDEKIIGGKVAMAEAETKGKGIAIPAKDESDDEETTIQIVAAPGHTLAKGEADQVRKMKIKHHLGEEKEDDEDEDMGEDDVDEMLKGFQDDDAFEAYEDDEFHLEDEDTGEKLEELQKEEVINEVLSRLERIKAKARFKRTEAKRERRVKIALKMRSSNKTLNNRARKLAITLMKKRIGKKDPSKMSVAEKERVERMVHRRKAVINRIAMKLVPRLRKIENNRLTGKHTKSSPSAGVVA